MHPYTEQAADIATQVIERANNSAFGLAAGIFSKDLDIANEMSRRLKAGTVWINNCWFMLSPEVPFGGYKQSGLGIEGGQAGIEAFTKVLCILCRLWLTSPRDLHSCNKLLPQDPLLSRACNLAR